MDDISIQYFAIKTVYRRYHQGVGGGGITADLSQMLFCFVIVVLLSLLMINLLSNFQNFLKLPSIKHVMKSGQITHFSYLTKSPLINKQFSYLMLTIHMYKNYDISSFTYQAI